MEGKYYVYTHELDEEIIYVGKGSGRRAWKFGDRSKLWKDTVGDNIENLIIKKVKHFTNEQDAYKYEAELIEYYMSLGQSKCNTNLGQKHAEEVRSLISKKGKGQNNSMYGKTFTEEHKRKLGESRTGVKNHLHGKTGGEHTSAKRAVAIFPNGQKMEAPSKKELVAIINEEYGISGSMINRLIASGEPLRARYKKHEKAKGMVVKYVSA